MAPAGWLCCQQVAGKCSQPRHHARQEDINTTQALCREAEAAQRDYEALAEHTAQLQYAFDQQHAALQELRAESDLLHHQPSYAALTPPLSRPGLANTEAQQEGRRRYRAQDAQSTVAQRHPRSGGVGAASLQHLKAVLSSEASTASLTPDAGTSSAAERWTSCTCSSKHAVCHCDLLNDSYRGLVHMHVTMARAALAVLRACRALGHVWCCDCFYLALKGTLVLCRHTEAGLPSCSGQAADTIPAAATGMHTYQSLCPLHTTALYTKCILSYFYLNMPLCTHAFSPDVSECHVLTRSLIFDMILKVHFVTRCFSSVLSSLQMQPAFCRTWSCVCMRSTKRAALAGLWRSCKRSWRACRTTMRSCRCARTTKHV